MLNFSSKKPEATSAEIPVCLCKIIMKRIPEPPKLLYSAARREYLMYCPTCKMKTHPDSNKQAVISEWYGMNASGLQHIQDLWLERYEIQKKESISTQLYMGPRSHSEVTT